MFVISIIVGRRCRRGSPCGEPAGAGARHGVGSVPQARDGRRRRGGPAPPEGNPGSGGSWGRWRARLLPAPAPHGRAGALGAGELLQEDAFHPLDGRRRRGRYYGATGGHLKASSAAKPLASSLVRRRRRCRFGDGEGRFGLFDRRLGLLHDGTAARVPVPTSTGVLLGSCKFKNRYKLASNLVTIIEHRPGTFASSLAAF